MHANVTFILKDEMLNLAFFYINDVLIKESKMRYEIEEEYKTISGNTNIQRFI